jgi:hypothetical protein
VKAAPQGNPEAVVEAGAGGIIRPRCDPAQQKTSPPTAGLSRDSRRGQTMGVLK